MPWAGNDGCVTVRAHSFTDSSARALLRGTMQRSYPFLSERDITDKDLEGKTKDELVLMRNEPFAAYGHTFKTEALAKQFKARPGYRPYFVDVGAFLSPIEKANVERIKAKEKALEKK
jgi:hypothetical protein